MFPLYPCLLLFSSVVFARQEFDFFHFNKNFNFTLQSVVWCSHMSSIATFLFKATIGWLVNKGRDVTVEKLKEGDVADKKVRDLIVREVEDIKSKWTDYQERISWQLWIRLKQESGFSFRHSM